MPVQQPEAPSVLKDRANTLFKDEQYLKAAAMYTQALKLEPEAENQAVLHR